MAFTKPLSAPGRALPDLAIWVGLLLAIFLVYGQVQHFEFVSYDDPEYVTENPYVRAGLTVDGIKWAFTSPAVGNWTPVTMLSHQVVAGMFGMDAGAHHMVNVLLHALAALLLFAALQRATRARWPSAFVAAIFALHPLHVESVAWISERKDVLSAFFAFLALYAYVRYTERESVPRYTLVAVSFALALMSKPMLVTFPFLLLLLDVWPLRRARSPKLLLEKVPLLLLAAADSVVTYLMQGAAVQAIPLALRLRIALVSYVIYIRDMFWPASLTVFYPYHAVPVWQVTLAAIVLVAVSALAIFCWRTRPYLAIGWFWFLGTLVPAVGIVQVGAQSHADRYTYIPMIGLSMMLAWGAAEIQRNWPVPKTAIAALAAACCLVWMVLTTRQTALWQNSGTLFEHALEVTEDNWLAQSGLGIYLAQTGHPSEAIPHFAEVLRMIPGDSTTHYTLGTLLANMPGRQNEAITHFEAAIRIHPDYKEAHYNLGIVLSQIPGRTAEAIQHLDAARRIEPSASISQLIERLSSDSPPPAPRNQ